MTKRTSVNLDMQLVANARAVLGTKGVTDTLHRAMEDVVRREALRSLAEWDIGGFSLDDLAASRRPSRWSVEGARRTDGEAPLPRTV